MVVDWAIAAALGKWLFYLSLVMLPGWLFLRLISRRIDQTWPARPGLLVVTVVLTAVLAAMLLLIQIGDINQRGLAGMFDPVMREILLTTPNGTSLYWRLGGLLLWGTAIAGLWFPRLLLPLAVTGTFCLAISFAVTGHVATLDGISQFFIILHIIAVAAWAGSVFLLCLLLRPLPANESIVAQWHNRLRQYGKLAVPVLALMLISGAYLYVQLLGWSVWPDHTYHWLMLCKLALVALMLLMAARHKFRLVPAIQLALMNPLSDESSVPARQVALSRMRVSLFIEAVFAMGILGLVAVMTTLVGPETLHH